jgi:hypothetical protein
MNCLPAAMAMLKAADPWRWQMLTQPAAAMR